MAKEPNKSPDDKEDDLFDEGLDEIDIDDLLVDDDTPLKKEEATAPAPEKMEGKDSKPDIIDDGEIDLLADDLQEPAEPVLAEDLLDLEEELPAEAGRQTTLDAAAGPRVESPTNGNPSGLDEEMAVSSEAKDDDDADFDLLAEEGAPLSLLDDLDAGTSAGTPDEPALGAPGEPALGSPGDSALGTPSDSAPGLDTPALGPSVEKTKSGKLKRGKPLKLGKKEKKGKGKEKEDEGAEALVEKEKPSKERAPREKRVALPAGARGSITFVCSECYEEFLIPSSYSQEMVSCPECLHVGKRPDDEFLRTVHLHKAGEKRSFLTAVVVGALLFAVVIALMWMHTPYGAAQAGSEGTFSVALLGAAGLLTVILIWLVVRFEGNRWEVYF